MKPSFSIVIPTYRRLTALASCLRSLTALCYPRDEFEVMIVNDGGEPVNAVAGSFADRLDVRVLNQTNAGPGAARNRGAAAARGKYLAFTDDDCHPDRNWLAAFAAHLAARPGHVIGGRVTNMLLGPRHLCSAASQLLISYLYGYYNSAPTTARFFTSNNIAVERRAFLAVGGFDVNYHRAAAEDREFCDRWVQSGQRMVYAPDAIVRHAHRLSLREFCRQHFQYGRGALHYRQARAARNAGPVQLEPMHFYRGLLTYPWKTRAPMPEALAALLVVAQTANAIGFFREKWFGPAVPPARKIEPEAAALLGLENPDSPS